MSTLHGDLQWSLFIRKLICIIIFSGSDHGVGFVTRVVCVDIRSHKFVLLTCLMQIGHVLP